MQPDLSKDGVDGKAVWQTNI